MNETRDNAPASSIRQRYAYAVAATLWQCRLYFLVAVGVDLRKDIQQHDLMPKENRFLAHEWVGVDSNRLEIAPNFSFRTGPAILRLPALL